MFKRLTERIKPTLTDIIIIVIAAFVIVPNIAGYATYGNAKGVPNGEELVFYKANLSACSEFNEKLLARLGNFSSEFSECKTSLDVLKINYTYSSLEYENAIKELEEELGKKREEIMDLESEKEKEIGAVRAQYDVLAKNSANNICCKARVDNSRINYYKIENDRIVCLEDGTMRLACA